MADDIDDRLSVMRKFLDKLDSLIEKYRNGEIKSLTYFAEDKDGSVTIFTTMKQDDPHCLAKYMLAKINLSGLEK